MSIEQCHGVGAHLGVRLSPEASKGKVPRTRVPKEGFGAVRCVCYREVRAGAVVRQQSYI